MAIETEQTAIEWRANYENASTLLNDYYDFYKGRLHPILRKYVEICIQSVIFQLDISFEIVNISTLKPVGFARKVVFKGLLLRLVEFQRQFEVRTLNEDFRNYVIEMNNDLGRECLVYPVNEIASLRRNLSSHFNEWGRLKEIRNDAAGHYRRLDIQLPALELIDPDEVLKVALVFNTYIKNTLDLMAKTHPADLKLTKYT